ncbi:MAG: DUF3368 domain-containing protein [Saprospiraceae bacterium]
MPKAIISDTSCLILLTKIGELDLLELLYGEVLTTTEVANEYGLPLPSWVKTQVPKDFVRVQILGSQIDIGEASAIALALEIPKSTVILDDWKARQMAERLNLEVTGTLGVIVKAKLTGKISSIKPLLEKIKNTNFRLSADLTLKALEAAGEL